MLFPSFKPELESQINNKLSDIFKREQFIEAEIKFKKLKTIFEAYIKTLKANNTKIITIGGTNGKGETVFHLAQTLKQHGKTFSLWTSPHVLSIRERFQDQNGVIEYKKLDDLIDHSLKDIQAKTLSYYEFLFYVFCKFACRNKCEYVILEVGLGGRLDAVNVFDADLTALVSLGLDHTEILGNSYKQILNEKIAITRKSIELLTSFDSDYQNGLVKEHQLAKGFVHHNLSAHMDQSWSFSQRNQFLASKLAQSLIPDIDAFWPQPERIKRFKGRFEQVTLGSIQFNFVGSHNFHGVKALLFALKNTSVNYDEIWVSFSNRKEAELKKMIKLISCETKKMKLILFQFNHQRSIDLNKLEDKAFFEKYCDEVHFSSERSNNYFEQKVLTSRPQSILVTGSYYFIGEMQKSMYSCSSHSFTKA